MNSPGVMLTGNKNRAETTRPSAAVYCAGARIVASAGQLAVLLDMNLGVPLIAIVPPGQKRKALRGRVDATYVRPVSWSGYLRLVERLIFQWAVTRIGSRPRRGRTS